MNSREFASLQAHDRVRLDHDNREWVVAYRQGANVHVHVVGSLTEEKTLTPAQAGGVTRSTRQ